MGALPARPSSSCMCCKESSAAEVIIAEKELGEAQNNVFFLQEPILVHQEDHENLDSRQDGEAHLEAEANFPPPKDVTGRDLEFLPATPEVAAEYVAQRPLDEQEEVSPDGTPHCTAKQIHSAAPVYKGAQSDPSSSRFSAAVARPARSPTSVSGSNPVSPASSKKSLRSQRSQRSRVSKGVKSVSLKLASSLGITQTKTSGNSNRPDDYSWLKECISKLTDNSASSINCLGADLNEGFVPIFFVIGACPNVFCGMQAVMYCRSRSRNKVDFWWVKPKKKSNGTELEQETLNRNTSGPHKNDPGRSRQFYQPLADVFEESASVQGWCFGIEEVSASPDTRKEFRAFLRPSQESTERFYVHLFWTEDWTSNPWAAKKFIKGKVVYQKRAGQLPLFAREYEIVDEVISIFDVEEQLNCTDLPDDTVKNLWQKTESKVSGSKSTGGFTLNPKFATMLFKK